MTFKKTTTLLWSNTSGLHVSTT